MIGKEYYDKEEKKMALFKRNPNEADYYGGKKHFIDVIKNNGANTYLFWRQPEEDFNTHSKLIVMPGRQQFLWKVEILFNSFQKERMS